MVYQTAWFLNGIQLEQSDVGLRDIAQRHKTQSVPTPQRVIFRSMRSFRLGILLCAALAPASFTFAQTGGKTLTPDLKEIRDYRLTMDVVQRYVKAFSAATTDAAARKCFESSPPGNAPSLDAGEKLINGCPAAASLIKSAGLKPREFLIITGALMGDVMAVGLKKSGTIKEYPQSVSPENAAFVEQNYDKLQTLLTPLMNNAK